MNIFLPVPPVRTGVIDPADAVDGGARRGRFDLGIIADFTFGEWITAILLVTLLLEFIQY